jgi:DNA-binding response OmpR family regulator
MEYGKDEGVVRAGDCAIDVNAHLVRYKDQVIPYLTCKEFELLYFLVKKRPQVLSRKHILSKLWHTIAVDRVVDTHLANLRKKLPVELADKIQSVPGKGYRFLE